MRNLSCSLILIFLNVQVPLSHSMWFFVYNSEINCLNCLVLIYVVNIDDFRLSTQFMCMYKVYIVYLTHPVVLYRNIRNFASASVIV